MPSPKTQNVQTPLKDPVPGEVPSAKRRSPWLLVAACGLIVVFAFVIYSGIHGRAEAETALGDRTERVSVPVVTAILPIATTSSEDVILPGNTQAFNDTPIYARTNGYLKRWYVDIGSHVKQGQLLAEIETPEVDQQLAQARADAKNALANFQLAQTTSTRWQNLLKTNAVSKQETDQAVSDLSAKEASFESMSANVRRLEQLQAFERVTAPFSGVITTRNTDIGALINAGSGALPQELFHIAAVDKLRVYIAVPEVDVQAAQTGAKASITFDEFPGELFEGTIVRDSDSIDPASRTLNVEVDVDNTHGRIKPGAYAFVHLTRAKAKQGMVPSVTVPANTLLFRSEGLRVAVVRNDRAELVPITIGQDFGATVEVVAGLHASDRVIVNPSDSLTGGTKVKISDPQTGDAKR